MAQKQNKHKPERSLILSTNGDISLNRQPNNQNTTATLVMMVQDDRKLLVKVQSELTDSVVEQLHYNIMCALEQVNPVGLVIDLSQVTSLDSMRAKYIMKIAHMIRTYDIKTSIIGIKLDIALAVGDDPFVIIDQDIVFTCYEHAELMTS